MPSPGILWHCMQVVHMYICMLNIHRHKKMKFLKCAQNTRVNNRQNKVKNFILRKECTSVTYMYVCIYTSIYSQCIRV